MKTFTLRDMDKRPRELIAACDQEGSVRIKLQNGCTYLLTPETNGNNCPMPDFKARMKAAGMKRLSVRQSRLLAKMIAGE